MISRKDRRKAKQVIVEIVRQNGGQISKRRLYQAFYLAHLYYFKDEPGFLTDWPIVREGR